MSTQDPTAPDTNFDFTEEELTIEEAAQMQALDFASPDDAEARDLDAQHAASSDTQADGDIPNVSPRIPPVLLRKRAVSGRYRVTKGMWQLELRVDVDGTRPMMRVSGDFFKVSGATTTYFGSFTINAPSVAVTASTVTIDGVMTSTYATGYPRTRITIKRKFIITPPGDAIVQFMTIAGSPGANYVCPYESRFFRTVQYEQDRVANATLFNNYNTGTLPSGGAARDLTVVKAFAEAGIEFQTTSATNVIPTAGVGSAWSNAELHAAMESHFSLYQNAPNWKVWMFAANIHDMGTGLRGIMFDQQGKQRQGCAVFHDVVGGSAAEVQRAMLRTYVHELGHCFNLLHSFQKSYATPPIPDRPAAKSWMNYVGSYPGGASAYWADFPFHFDDPEVIHLRHAYRNNVIIGGSDFGGGAAESDGYTFADRVEDRSGLSLELSARQSFQLGEPVVVKLKLATADRDGHQAYNFLHPNMHFVQLAIRQPGGKTVVYEPMIHHCVAEETGTLRPDAAIEESAYIGYGKAGFYFDQNGVYDLRALYYAPDGSQVLSNTITLRVRHPKEAADEEIADLYMGSDQGKLFYLLGSDSEFLRRGNEAFDTVLDKYAAHPLADYARLARGVNLGREFKQVTADKQVLVREPQYERSMELLTEVVRRDDPGAGVDRLTREMIAERTGIALDPKAAARDGKAAKNGKHTKNGDDDHKPLNMPLAERALTLTKAARAGMY